MTETAFEVARMDAFPTPIIMKQWEGVDDLNTALKLAIYKRRAADPTGVYKSNSAGCWHSDVALLKWCGEDDLAQKFAQMFRAMGEQYANEKGGHYDVRMEAWAMVSTDRGYATVHTHPNCHFSGVYYVDEGEQSELTMATGVNVQSGQLEFVDTRGGSGLMVPGLNLSPAFRLTPKPGLMVIFPSWLPHFVHPVQGEVERISIACNATIQYRPPAKEQTS